VVDKLGPWLGRGVQLKRIGPSGRNASVDVITDHRGNARFPGKVYALLFWGWRRRNGYGAYCPVPSAADQQNTSDQYKYRISTGKYRDMSAYPPIHDLHCLRESTSLPRDQKYMLGLRRGLLLT